MKNIKFALIVLAAVALLPMHAEARKGVTSQIARKGKAPTVTISASYSGTLRGDVLMGSETVTIGPKAVLVDRRGADLKPGDSVSHRSVTVSGRRAGGKLVASMVIVGDAVSGKDFSEVTLPDMKADPKRAR